MVHITSKAVCEKGYTTVVTKSPVGDPVFTYRYVLIAPVDEVSGPSIDVDIDSKLIGDLIPPKNTRKRYSQRLSVQGSVYNSIVSPNGKTLNGVMHSSIDGSISFGGFKNSYPVDIGVAHTTFYTHEKDQTRTVFTDDTDSFERFYCAYTQEVYDRTKRGEWYHDYHYDFDIDKKMMAMYVALTKRYYSFTRGQWVVEMAVYATSNVGGVSRMTRTVTAMGTYKRAFEDMPPMPQLPYATLKSMLDSDVNQWRGRTLPLADPSYPVSEGQIPPLPELIKTLNEHCRVLTSFASLDTQTAISESWSFCAMKALDKTRYIPTNQFEFWKDIGLTFSEVGAFRQLLDTVAATAAKGFKGLMRKLSHMTDDAANAYLSTYYGTRLTMSDLELISNGIADYIWAYYSQSRKMPRESKGTELFTIPCRDDEDRSWTVRTNYLFNYNPFDGSSEFREITFALGIDPTLDHIWECIPLSFVVDWFFDVSSTLRAWENKRYYTSLAINHEVKSYRVTRDISREMLRLHGWTCDLGYTLYSRFVSYKPTVIPGVHDRVGNPIDHWVQGAALIIQRRKK